MVENKVKYGVIYHYRNQYSVKNMCHFFRVSRSAYYEWLEKKDLPNKDAEIVSLIKQGYYLSKGTYGYRRIHIWLKKKHGIHLNIKKVRRIMRIEQLQSIARKRLKYKMNLDQMHRYSNILNREFKAEKINQKWVTDITYIPTREGFMYLSVIKDLHDGFIVSYEMSSNMTVNLVLNTVKTAMQKEKVANGLVLHSDQGFQYTSHAYHNLTKHYSITPSMSRRGNCLDNACCENFFGHLKEECVRHCNFNNHKEAKLMIAEYIDFYNKERIQLKSEMTPYEIRYHLTA